MLYMGVLGRVPLYALEVYKLFVFSFGHTLGAGTLHTASLEHLLVTLNR